MSDYSASHFAGKFLTFPLYINYVLWLSFTSIWGLLTFQTTRYPKLHRVFFLASSQNCEKLCHVWLPSVRPSARREYLGSQRTDFHENRYLRIFRKPVKIIKASIKLTKLLGTLYKNLCMLMETSRWIFRGTRNVSGNVQNNQITLYSITFFPKSCRCKVMRKNTI
jgi:hypothetical protein